jgi:hypothetical protein
MNHAAKKHIVSYSNYQQDGGAQAQRGVVWNHILWDIVRLKSKYPSINDIGILVGSFLEMLTVVQLVERKFNQLNFMRCGC